MPGRILATTHHVDRPPVRWYPRLILRELSHTLNLLRWPLAVRHPGAPARAAQPTRRPSSRRWRQAATMSLLALAVAACTPSARAPPAASPVPAGSGPAPTSAASNLSAVPSGAAP